MAKIVSEYDQEIPQSQTADNPVAQGKLSKIEYKWCNLNQLLLYLSHKLCLVNEKI